MQLPRALCLILIVDTILPALCAAASPEPSSANRFTYLDESDPFYVHRDFPKLTTPQWIGEAGVETVVILAIDDMRSTEKYEAYLRPILNRLKQIDGRAPVSIFCNALDPLNPQLASWLNEGLSLEIHTLSHPCPLLARSNFVAAADTYHGCVELLNQVAGNRPVAFRMPCCDSMNSPSPRFYAEIFNRTNSAGQFLTIDSSVMNITTSADASLPRELVLEPDGRERFRKYVPFPSFVTTIENYPYPYVIGRQCWEFPAMAPSDWEAQNIHGTNNPATVADWKAALDATVLKQGTFTFIFHPHGWIKPEQLVEFIDHAVARHGKKVRFMNFREAQERLDQHLLGGVPLRDSQGRDNGVRLLDLNQDGFLDVLLGNDRIRRSRVWQPNSRRWEESSLPVAFTQTESAGGVAETGVRIGVVRADRTPTLFHLNESVTNAWSFVDGRWREERVFTNGLELGGEAVQTARQGRDQGARLRDIDRDGRCEWIVGNPTQRGVLSWSDADQQWRRLAWSLPENVALVDAEGRDAGLRFVDLNGDGYDDLVFSNEERYSVHVYILTPKDWLGWDRGWSFEVMAGRRGDPGEVPMIVRRGDYRNNGAWFHSRHFWVQNEDTAHLPDKVDRRSFDQLFIGAESAPKSPEESLAAMQVRPGFKVELVASEPQVIDPVAFDWGLDGKLWVVEMRDYPLGMDGKGRPGGVVKFLEDLDQDGRYEKATVFLEGLNFPSGIMVWRQGVLISAAPEIIYAEDADGDGKAELKRTLMTGFREGNQQHRVNGFEWGLDNWVYAANGDSGGMIRAVGGVLTGHGPSSAARPEINLRGRDLRFKPDEGVFETVLGSSQFGRRRDDWGNWFGNNNPNWLWHYLIEERYLARNPHTEAPAARRMLANYEEPGRVFAISRAQTRFNWADTVNHLTSANSPAPYRDDLFGPAFSSSVFASEPAHNVIHREVLVPKGVSFTSRRADDEQDREFLASADNWFRPTMLRTGPDGALYVADMYRLVLEHPEYFPDELKNRPDLRAGDDKGRIYRIYPTEKRPRPVPRLDRLKPVELAGLLDSPNGWIRDTAQRLLVQSGGREAGGKVNEAAGKLQELVRDSPNPRTRLQAAATLDGMGLNSPRWLYPVLSDRSPAVVEMAVRLAEPHLRAVASVTNRTNPGTVPPALPGFAELAGALTNLVTSPEIRVRHQLALSLGEWDDPKAGATLARLAMGGAENDDLQIAIMTSAPRHLRTMLKLIAAATGNLRPPAGVLSRLVGLAAAMGDQEALRLVLDRLAKPGVGDPTPWRMEVFAGLLGALDRQGKAYEDFTKAAVAEIRPALTRLASLHDDAIRLALNTRAADAERMQALTLLGRTTANVNADIEALLGLSRPQESDEVRQAAFDRLKRIPRDEVAEQLIREWKSAGPDFRLSILSALLSRAEWTRVLLASTKSGRIAPTEIGPVHRQLLTMHNDSSIRSLARKLFAPSDSDRQKVIRRYARVEQMTGVRRRGGELYEQHCAMCHSFQGTGSAVGPPIETVRDKPAALLLAAILDPNQAIDAAYTGYTVATRGGRELTGIMVSETAGSIRLRVGGGIEETISRSDIESLTGSKLSLMPEGFENALGEQEMADLIAFIRGQ